MKNINVFIIIVLFLSMVFCPLLSIKNEVPKTENPQNQSNVSITEQQSPNKIKVLRTKSKEIISVSREEYLTGVVSAEMSADYSEEALKAQAVAAFTFLCYRINGNTKLSYDITDSYESDQTYISQDERKEKWKENFEQNEKKVKSAVDAVKGYIIAYDGKAIFAAYHSVSSGKTENGQTVFGEEFSYLSSVESAGDVLSSGYLNTVTVTKDEFAEKIKQNEITLSDDAENWIGEIKRTETGMVALCKICDTEVEGTTLRKIFSLRSANFDLEYSDGNFIFTTRGYGHGVGMSQYGAQFMALQGSNFIEILSWYYPNCQLATIK